MRKFKKIVEEVTLNSGEIIYYPCGIVNISPLKKDKYYIYDYCGYAATSLRKENPIGAYIKRGYSTLEKASTEIDKYVTEEIKRDKYQELKQVKTTKVIYLD